MDKKNTQCQSDLRENGYFITKLTLPASIYKLVQTKNYDQIDSKFHTLTAKGGVIFKELSHYADFTDIEFIISLREAQNEWEEDGIWHDDGSRKLAFSLSLTLDEPEGGVLEIRKKSEESSQRIKTPPYSHMIVFATGAHGFEHKINQVTKGARLIIAGWCS